MKTRWIFGIVTLVAALGLFVGESSAKDKKTEKGEKDEELSDWDAMDVGAGVLRPRGDTVMIGGPDTASSLLQIRQDFVDELIRSAEDL